MPINSQGEFIRGGSSSGCGRPILGVIVLGVIAVVAYNLIQGSMSHANADASATADASGRARSTATAQANTIAQFTATAGPNATVQANAIATASARSNPTPTTPPSRASFTPLSGSWVAASSPLRIRFFAVPWWVPKPDLTGSSRLSLGTISTGADFEAVDAYRLPNDTGIDASAAWRAEVDSFGHASGVTGFALTSGPRPQRAAGYDGFVGQYHYTQAGNGVRIDGTLWVGLVNGDRVVMNFRCDPADDQRLDQAVAQVLATIDFGAN